MATHLLSITDEPCEWTAGHDRLLATVRAAGLTRTDPKPSTVRVLQAIEDVDECPLALVEVMLPSISS